MGALSIWHIVILLAVVFVMVYPIARILQRAGWSGWLSILWLIPIVNIIMLWVFAFGRWPTLEEHSN